MFKGLYVLIPAGWAVHRVDSPPPASTVATSCFTQVAPVLVSQAASAVEAGVSANTVAPCSRSDAQWMKSRPGLKKETI